MPFDPTPYFAHLGYTGPRTATLATLQALHALHPRAIPFENLDTLLGTTPKLDAASLVDKLVTRRRGGYCFEHNLLFAAVLRELGFELTLLEARVQWNLPPEHVNTRTHTLLRVLVEGVPYFADVGFGGLTMTAPLRAAIDVVQTTPHEPFRLVALDGAGLQVQAEVRGDFKPLYRFDLQPQEQVDYELANHWIATHPDSLFVQRLLAARVDGETRHALLNNAYAEHRRDGTTERRTLASATELREVLEGPFGIQLPEGPGLEPLLRRLTATEKT